MPVHANTEHIDGILSKWKDIIGADYDGYRNHVVRMASFCMLLRPCSDEEKQKIEIAACFHDIGLWTDHTLDYLEPSVPPALKYLDEIGHADWSEEISQMILEHHKLTSVKNGVSPLVELFRQGDLVDFSLGMVRFGLPALTVKTVKQSVPNAGFHKTLMRMAGRWFLRHPLNPMPMMKW